jgi:hypothetical protein
LWPSLTNHQHQQAKQWDYHLGSIILASTAFKQAGCSRSITITKAASILT